jgi:cell division protease FtsH
MTLGGRAAEEIIFGKISTGAQSDLQHITKLSYSMVTIYGMNPKVGNVSFYDPNNEYGFTKPYSDRTAELIDEEVRQIIAKAYERTKQLLTEHKDALETIAQELLSKEVLFQADLERLIGKRPYEIKAEEETPSNIEISGTVESTTTEATNSENDSENTSDTTTDNQNPS